MPQQKPLFDLHVIALTFVMLLIIAGIAFILVNVLPNNTTTIEIVNESQEIHQDINVPVEGESILDR